jgi:hypothetical protein
MSDHHEPALNRDAVQTHPVRAREVTRESMRLTLADPPEHGWIASRRYYGDALASAFRAKR